MSTELRKEQHHVIRYCFRRGMSVKNTFNEMKGVYKDDCLDRSSIGRWFKSFSGGRESAESPAKPGRPSTSTTDELIGTVAAVVRGDRHLSLRKFQVLLDISKSSLHRILKDHLQMRRVCSS